MQNLGVNIGIRTKVVGMGGELAPHPQLSGRALGSVKLLIRSDIAEVTKGQVGKRAKS